MPEFPKPKGDRFTVVIELDTMEEFNEDLINAFIHTVIQPDVGYEIENNQEDVIGEIQLTKVSVRAVTFRG